ncbi:hypothetical protein HJFPF1_04493 [Paramyrothecium foliicola]|nr:hypothetical protein HJFPF1_04493 [Paramyrothecium foliicola]
MPVTQVTDGYGPIEQSRPLVRGAWHGLVRLFLHLPALLFTTIILWTYYAKVYWFDETGLWNHSISTANILNALQLAAKLYELTVLASLADITLKIFKRRLIRQGLPMGILSGGYRVGDVFYLCSPHFWAAAPRVVWLAVLLVAITLLSVLVGPASAILLVPELGWFPLDGAFSRIPLPIYLETQDILWPTFLEKRLWENQTYCLEEQGNYIPSCPASGFADLFSWANGWSVANLSNSILFQTPSGRASRHLQLARDSSAGIFATVPMLVTALTLGQLQSYIDNADMGAISATLKYKLQIATESSDDFYQPLINSKCNIWNMERYNNTSEVPAMAFPSTELRCFSEDENDACHRLRALFGYYEVTKEFWNSNETSATYGFGTVEDEDDPTLSSPSFVARLPFNNNGTIGIRIAACSFMARWIPTIFAIDPTNSSIITTNITTMDMFTKEGGSRLATDGSSSDQMIRIDRSWLSLLDPEYNISREADSNDSEVRTQSERVSSFGSLMAAVITMEGTAENGALPGGYIGPGSGEDAMTEASDMEVAVLCEKLLASLLTDAVSRTGAGHDATLVQPSEDKGSLKLINLSSRDGAYINELTMLANGELLDQSGRMMGPSRYQSLDDFMKSVQAFIKLDLRAEQFGYGYGQAKETTRFALGVIYTYLTVLLVYSLFVQIRQASSVAAWGDMQDLLALVWSSSPPQELINGGSVVDKSFWKDYVAIRATRTGQAKLVVNDEQPTLSRLKRGEKYQ